ncbi:MAG: hypothetical protein IJR36_09045 [Lachnospiraceae bacterium]|nr:hypothetical protein [Lachnospiraceae bacterium]MBR0152935.1 hypothetical protein [Lachnospiraceae bacterium]
MKDYTVYGGRYVKVVSYSGTGEFTGGYTSSGNFSWLLTSNSSALAKSNTTVVNTAYSLYEAHVPILQFSGIFSSANGSLRRLLVEPMRGNGLCTGEETIAVLAKYVQIAEKRLPSGSPFCKRKHVKYVCMYNYSSVEPSQVRTVLFAAF